MTRSRRLWFLLVIGLGGASVLLALGAWQVSRLFEKRAQIAAAEADLARAPVTVAGGETASDDNFRPAAATGRFVPDAPVARFLTTERPHGPGFRLISPFELASGDRILVDRGYAPEAAAPRGGAAPPPPEDGLQLTGALHWPREASAFTPDPNARDRLWFARDVASLADALDTRPVMLVLAETPAEQVGRWPQARPVGVDLPNNHLSYAITWFSLAAIWTVMSVFLVARRRRQA